MDAAGRSGDTPLQDVRVRQAINYAIDREATAVYRRSAKQGAERFQWSCRLQVSQEPCF